MPSKEFIFWTDLECTGSTLEDNDMIEIGAAITDFDLNVLDTKSIVLPTDIPFGAMNEVVQKMHTKNGLWADVATTTWTKDGADLILADWIDTYGKGQHLPFAGSGVAHYDRQFIKRDLPQVNKRLTYWALDVGVLRRTFEFFTDIPWLEDRKTHRALDDILYHIEEMRYAITILRSAPDNGSGTMKEFTLTGMI